MKIDWSLRVWFLVHFLVDYIIAIPLFFFPLQTLSFLGWHTIDPLATRIVAAALFAIGGVSFVAHSAGPETYRHLLTLKIIWSFIAIIALDVTAIHDNAPWGTWAAIPLFMFFGSLWVYYRLKL